MWVTTCIPPDFVNVYWLAAMPVGTVTDNWAAARWPPSHLATELPTAPSVEPYSCRELHAFRSGVLLQSAFWNVGQGHGRETGCIQELQKVSPSTCLHWLHPPWSWLLGGWLDFGKECFASEEFLRGFPVAECSHLCNSFFFLNYLLKYRFSCKLCFLK